MAVRPRYIKQAETPNQDPRDPCPVVTLLYLSRQGIVFCSRRRFDTGTKLAIGLQLDKVRADLGLAKSDSFFDLNPFLDVQGFVADCKIMEATPGGVSYQVTLLFDGLDEADEMLVGSIERELKLCRQGRTMGADRQGTGLN